MTNQKVNFWTQLETKKITGRGEIEQHLTQKLGTPTNQLAFNCLTELTKKITSYYIESLSKNYTAYSLVGVITSPEQILEKKFKEGKRMGQTYYVLKVGTEQLQATETEIEPDKWQQIKKLAIVGKDLVFKYRKFYTNKQLLDFYSVEKEVDCQATPEMEETESPEEKMGKALLGKNEIKNSKR